MTHILLHGRREPATVVPDDKNGDRLRLDGRPKAWYVPTNASLVGPDHDTDREWYARRKWYQSGWANDPSWSQSKRVKPTHTDPEDDRRVDLALLRRHGTQLRIEISGQSRCLQHLWEAYVQGSRT